MKQVLVGTLVLAVFGMARGDGPTDDFKREGPDSRRAQKDALENKPAAPLSVKGWMNTDGKELKLKDLRGKVVVLDFWGVWCPPCRAAIPHLKELYKQHKGEGLVIIGVHTTNQGDRMADFVKKEGIPWPVAVDMDQATVKGYRVDSYPDYYLIDRSGKLRVADLQNSDLDRAVKILLQEKVPVKTGR
jgi:thiol-disulfide isomerase/thioredoxin